MRNFCYSIVAVFFGLISCKTDFDINAPYQTIPVVYGLLDQSLDTQWVKINRSYLGEGNNVDFAGINDCTQFNGVIAVIEEYNSNGSLIDVDTLEETYVGDIDPGVFYQDSQKIYFLATENDPLNDENEYHLKVNVPAKDLNFDAKTELIDGSQLRFDQWFEQSFLRNGFRMADDDLSSDDFLMGVQVKWLSATNAKRYELMMRFHFIEHWINGDTLKRYVEWGLGSKEGISVDYSGEELTKNIVATSFYDMVNSKLSSYNNEDQVVKRTLINDSNNIEFILTAGNEVFNTYMKVNEPVTGIVTERPIFTNVNNGVGLFASKYQKSINSFMAVNSILELCLGERTSHLKFCVDSVNYYNAIIELDAKGYDVRCD